MDKLKVDNIVFIEPQCKGYQHEEVNSAVIQTILYSFTYRNAFFYGESEHIDCIKKIWFINEVVFTEALQLFPVEVPDVTKKNTDFRKEYRLLFSKILQNHRQNDCLVVFLSWFSDNICMMQECMEERPQWSCIIICHGVTERIVERGFINVDRYKVKKSLNRTKGNLNIDYIVFGPLYKKVMRGKVSDAVLDRTLVLNLPFISCEDSWEHNSSDIIIGVMGACVNAYSKEIIDDIEHKLKDAKRTANFMVLDRNGDKIPDRDEVVGFLKKCDWLLLPYDHNKYITCCSGIFINAVNYCIPFFSLNSPLLNYYNKDNTIGVTCKNLKHLEKKMKYIFSLEEDDYKELYEKYVKNMTILKKTMVKDNTVRINQHFNSKIGC